MKRASLAVVGFSLFVVTSAHATILPPNNLHLQDNLHSLANITEAQFNAIVNSVIDVYKPLVVAKGAVLSSNNLWTDSTVNASASQSGNSWIVNMYGGLARRPEVTPDGFALVVCHELGHHLGGFAYYGNTDWAASEGQADYFATQACARKIWANDKVTNAQFRTTVGAFEKERCDASWKTADEQDLCYRAAAGGASLATLLSALRNGPAPRFETPDQKMVNSTFVSHPEAQCRLDTYFSGALCTTGFNENIIPGRNQSEGQTSAAAETVASETSCMSATGFLDGIRPRCWYKPNLQFLGIKFGSTEISESAGGNGNDKIDPGETLNVNFNLGNGMRTTTTQVKGKLTSPTAGISVVEGTQEFPDIPTNETRKAIAPFVVKVENTVQCGSSFDLKLHTDSQVGSVEFVKTFLVGTLVDSLAGQNETKIQIPDNTSAGIESVIASELEGTVTRAAVKVDITHTYPRDLKIYLVSPDGVSSALYPAAGSSLTAAQKSAQARIFSESGIHQTFNVAFAPKAGLGTWKLKVVDAAQVDIGTLDSWTLTLSKAVCGN